MHIDPERSLDYSPRRRSDLTGKLPAVRRWARGVRVRFLPSLYPDAGHPNMGHECCGGYYPIESSKHRIRRSIRGRCTTMRCFRVGRPPWLRKKGKDRNQLVQCSDLLCIGLKGAIHQPAASHLVPKARGVAAQASPADNLDIS